MIAVIILAILLPILLVAAFLLGRHLQRRLQALPHMSAVTRQHIDLFQGGQWNEAAVEAAKTRFRDLLERGEVAAIEASLRPGMHYVFQVRALAEIGTEDAGRILERQLNRRLSDDQLEQSWYWIDLASSLRSLHREESLPHLLRCAEEAGDIPLGHFLAAATVCFFGFAGYLRQADSPLGKSAMRLLHRALEGLRFGVPPNLISEARLGEAIETLWDHRPERACPLLARVAHEVLRLLRREEHLIQTLGDDNPEPEAVTWQISRLRMLEPALAEYLRDKTVELVGALSSAGDEERAEILRTLLDMRAEAGDEALALLRRPDETWAELAIGVLTWSKNPKVGPWLRQWTARQVPMTRRAHKRRQAFAPRKPSLPEDVPYQAVLRAMRGHGSEETERFLMLAARDWDPNYRTAAFESLGWWEPLCRTEVLATLEQGRRDPSLDVRQAARAALARLGERPALQWFRQALASENNHRLHETLQIIGNENLVLLWPELNQLADAEDYEIAHHARETLERFNEEMDQGRQ
ncbi:MAG: hypothetical protein FJ271_27285 [Planctomycetes bacterium]|nr:hypothetical protein [Planctomycetota bacterium]